MSTKALIYIERVVVIVGVSLLVHYLGGLDWPWAALIGALTSMVLSWLIRSGAVARLRNRPLTGGR